ncbi:MAG: (2Fe-2S)-binding protein [Betaproteobacteria bacterium]|jgi:aerobic carbon-monoxide dehydrogenase small subunit|nr:(2Fe-2S)-binding protein [Betaproteobacteria bacterium]NBT68783.1 (2Fe-2S)-binding protein [Betaproteobacteria bacterium]
MKVSFKLNGKPVSTDVEPRTLLVELIREGFNLTGTHVGCDTSQCGACTVHVNGNAVKSCTMLAVQAQDCDVLTIEGLGADKLHPMQVAFSQCHGLQCGFCTPGMIMSSVALLKQNPNPTHDQIAEGLEGNICRCTGYVNIVKAVDQAAKEMQKTAVKV